MFSVSSLLTTVVLALAVAATPTSIFERDTDIRDTFVRRTSPITLQSARRFNFTNAGGLLQRDQARARDLVAFAEDTANSRVGPAPLASSGSIPATNGAVDYTVSVCFH